MAELLRRSLSLLGHVQVGPVVLAVALYALSVVVCAQRWRTLLAGLGRPVRLRDTVLTLLGGIFINNVTPARVGGEVFRAALLRKRTGVDLVRTAVSIGYDRLTDVLALALMAAISASLWGRLLGRAWHELLPAGGLRVGIGVGLAVLLLGLGLRSLRRVQEWAGQIYERFQRYAPGWRALGLATAMGLLVWTLDILRVWLLARAVGVALSPLQVAPVSLAASLGGLVPTVGGLGAVEGGMTAALCLSGVGLDQALAVTLLERAISYGLATAVGGIVILALGGRRLVRRLRAGEASKEA